MTHAFTDSTRRSAELDGSLLLVPDLQPEPFLIQAVQASPCTQACPAGINVKSYVSLIAEERFAEALEVVRERCPLPGICGRICHHPCEEACERSTTGGAVAIRALKRFVADLELELPLPKQVPGPHKTERVAIIGSGPAGLTAAYDLRRAGYPVVVFEAEEEVGGMLRYGIADYRLPTEVLDTEIAFLRRVGIEIRTGCRIGEDLELETLLEKGYSAALFAVGAQKGRSLQIDGEDECAEVEDALTFLRRVNTGDRAPVSGRVLVIGGGSTAIEAARSALRLGAPSVEVVYRRHRGEMPADEEEIHVAADEGITFRFLTAPTRVLTRDGRLEALECLQVALGEPDSSGRRRPIPIPGSEFPIPADLVFAAVGQQAELGFFPDDLGGHVVERGRVKVDPTTAMTALRGVFAAGDVVTGPATVIEAIAAGHEAAEAIRTFLEEGTPQKPERHPGLDRPQEYEVPSPPPNLAPRLMPALAEIYPGREFEEVEYAFSPADAVAEAKRCVRCGPCNECRVCATSCNRRHIALRTREEHRNEPAVLLRAPVRLAASVNIDGAITGLSEDPRAQGYLFPKDTSFRPGELDPASARAVDLLPTRIVIDEDHCRGCAKCIEVCPFGAIHLVDETAAETTARLDSALCRGCNLCTAVCPTDATIPASLAPQWWGSRLEDLYQPLLTSSADRSTFVVLACKKRLERLEVDLGQQPFGIELVPLPCAGQVDAGMLLELYRHGAQGIMVAGCAQGHCRYECGGDIAAEQVERARAVLRGLGRNDDCLVIDRPEELEQRGRAPSIAHILQDVWVPPSASESKSGRA